MGMQSEEGGLLALKVPLGCDADGGRSLPGWSRLRSEVGASVCAPLLVVGKRSRGRRSPLLSGPAGCLRRKWELGGALAVGIPSASGSSSVAEIEVAIDEAESSNEAVETTGIP